MNRSSQFAPTGPPGRKIDSDMIPSDDESSRDSGICLMDVGSPTCFSSLASNSTEPSYSMQHDENAMEVEEAPVASSPPKRKKRITLRREKTCHVRLFDESPNSRTMFARPALTFRSEQQLRKRSLDSNGEYVPSKQEKREKPSHASDHYHLEPMDDLDDDSSMELDFGINQVRSNRHSQQSTSAETGPAKFTWHRHHSMTTMQPAREISDGRNERNHHLVVDYHLKTISTFRSSTYGRISAHTLYELMNGYSETAFNEKYILVDCRYPFEYAGGHIKNAINFFDRDKVSSLFFDDRGKRRFNKIPIFYCEFSQKRGPSMASALREDDRKYNSEIYPNCSYEEMYVLDLGFRNFFKFAKDSKLEELCEPCNYVEMSDPQFSHKLKEWSYHRRAAAGQTVMRSESHDSFIVSSYRSDRQTLSRAEGPSTSTENKTPAGRKETNAHRRVLFQGTMNSPTNFSRPVPQEFSPPQARDGPIPFMHLGDSV